MASIVLAGGGTAGHIEPALAVARIWQTEHPEDRIVFLGTNHGLEKTLVPAAGFTLRNITKVSISRKPSLSWFQIPKDLLAAINECQKILKDCDLLIGFGGYVSAPAYVGAKISGVPIVIHEANAKPGWANRLGALLTPYLAVANKVDSGTFQKALITGLPLRSDVANALTEAEKDWPLARKNAKVRLGFDPVKPLLLVMGGSQGSAAINAVIAQALPTFALRNMSILHSVGQQNAMPESTDSYRPVTYVHDMADAYLASDLIIARSGAVTCSEFRALGRYAVFVPLPIGNGEQFHNAQSLVSDNRAQIVVQQSFTAEYLENSIDSLLIAASQAPIAGSNVDAQAGQKIASLGAHALEVG